MTATFLPGRVSLLAASHQFPEQHLSNGELLGALEQLSGKRFARVAARIVPFLGIEGRHFSRSIQIHTSEPNPSNSDLAVHTIKDLLANSQHTLSDIDYLIGHTTTPDTQLPPNIAWVAEKLDTKVRLWNCDKLVQVSQVLYKSPFRALLCSTNPSPSWVAKQGQCTFDYDKGFLDQSQLVNYMQMGDGAGGVIIGPETSEGIGTISHCFTGQIGIDKSPGLSLDGGSASVYTQAGKARFHHSATDVRKSGEALFQASILALREQGFELDDFDYIIPHQASGRIDSMLAEALDIDSNKIVNDAKHWGNLGSAAIWCSFSNLVRSDKLGREVRSLF